jgi:hypothetical protein
MAPDYLDYIESLDSVEGDNTYRPNASVRAQIDLDYTGAPTLFEELGL